MLAPTYGKLEWLFYCILLLAFCAARVYIYSYIDDNYVHHGWSIDKISSELCGRILACNLVTLYVCIL